MTGRRPPSGTSPSPPTLTPLRSRLARLSPRSPSSLSRRSPSSLSRPSHRDCPFITGGLRPRPTGGRRRLPHLPSSTGGLRLPHPRPLSFPTSATLAPPPSPSRRSTRPHPRLTPHGAPYALERPSITSKSSPTSASGALSGPTRSVQIPTSPGRLRPCQRRPKSLHLPRPRPPRLQRPPPRTTPLVARAAGAPRIRPSTQEAHPSAPRHATLSSVALATP